MPVQSPAGAIGELSIHRSRERFRRLTLRLLWVFLLFLFKAKRGWTFVDATRGGQQKTVRGDIALLLVKFDHRVRVCVHSLRMGCR